MMTMQSIERWIRPFRAHLLSVAFLFGFLIDSITLSRVDQVFDNLVLFGYTMLAMGSLALLYLGISGRISERTQLAAARWGPYVVQFAFGGLLSGVLIFYSRSGSWYASWPFLLVIISVILGNELAKRRAQRLVFNLSILFIGIFSYLSLVIPVLLGKMGALIFFGSGVVALIVMLLYTRILYLIVPNFMALNTRVIVFALGSIYVGLNVLYFTNIIPPIPLSLKDIGIYHDVVRLGDGGYRLEYERGKWYQFFKDSDDVFHYRSGDEVFCFASVFAPTRLSTSVSHRWEYYDEMASGWITHAHLPYTIEGGRDQGFRGYTKIVNASSGLWRCTVETSRGQTIGSTKFKIDTEGEAGDLVTRVDL